MMGLTPYDGTALAKAALYRAREYAGALGHDVVGSERRPDPGGRYKRPLAERTDMNDRLEMVREHGRPRRPRPADDGGG